MNEVARLFSKPGSKRIKAGHGGTLDPLATGMLPILLGEATRYAETGLNAEKVYRVTFNLSYQTDTLDSEGEVTKRFNREVDSETFNHVLNTFVGEIDQIPPTYSAIHIDGERAYKLARKGVAVKMEARKVTIHAITPVSFRYPLATVDVHCSKGTYIRSLARDIGEKVGVGGCVTELRRLSTGGWAEQMMQSIDRLKEEPETSLLPLSEWLHHLPRLTLLPDEARRFLQGQRVQLTSHSLGEEEDVAVFSGDLLLGTGVLKAGLRHMVIHPARVLPSAQEVCR